MHQRNQPRRQRNRALRNIRVIRVIHVTGANITAMPLNTDKLTNVTHRPDGSLIARCPACAEAGNDNRGEHLIIFPNGRFGCATHPGDPEHRKKIFKLAGDRTGHIDPGTVRVTIRPKKRF